MLVLRRYYERTGDVACRLRNAFASPITQRVLPCIRDKQFPQLAKKRSPLTKSPFYFTIESEEVNRQLTSLNISIPESMQDFVNQQITSGNYNNASEYILHLINIHQQQATELETMLNEGIDRGPPIEVTDSWWEEKRSMLVEKFSG